MYFSLCSQENCPELNHGRTALKLQKWWPPSTPRRPVGGNRRLKNNATEGISVSFDQVWVYESYRRTVISTMEHPAHSSLLTKSSPGTCLEMIQSVEKQKSSTDHRESTNRHPGLSMVTMSWRRKNVKKILSSVERREASTVHRSGHRLRCIFGQIFLK